MYIIYIYSAKTNDSTQTYNDEDDGHGCGGYKSC